jgi:hypothetical protein
MAALFGPPMQLGFVVSSIERAVPYWAALGVGPFLLLAHIRLAECRYRGRPVRFDMSAALAQWGPVQVELIEQHDDVTTVYGGFAGAQPAPLHHVGVLADSIDDELARLSGAGIGAVQWGTARNGVRFAYVEAGALPGARAGTMVELIERSPPIEALFSRVRQAAAGWDGRDPLRSA